MKVRLQARQLVLFVLGFILTIFSTSASAQYRAGIQGAVTDPSGAVIPGATVTLVSNETNRTQQVQTDAGGVYTFSQLAPGNYTITVEQAGFQKKVLPSVVVLAEQRQSANVQLDPGQVTQTVTVSGDTAPAVDTENGSITGDISGQQIQSLPSFGRDPYQLLQLAPGVFGDTGLSNGGGTQQMPGNTGPGGSQGSTSIFQTENQVQISANGQRTTANDYQIDGVEVNSLAWGGAAVITPNEESVKDIQVQANPYSAENGRNSGAQVLVVSKNGTNDFHGSAFIKLDRPGLNAYQRWNGPSNPVQRVNNRFNQMGGSIGGPIVKNHFFFFFSYETLRNASSTTALNWYETPQFISTVTGTVPGSIASRILGYPGEGVSQNQIAPKTCAQAGINNPALCQVVTINGQYAGLDVGSPLRLPLGTPDPGYTSNGNFGVGGGLDGIPDVFFVQSVNPSRTVSQQFQGRADYQLNANNLLAFTVYWVPSDSTFYNGPTRAANLWHSNRLNYSASPFWIHTFSPSLLNEARFNVTRWYFNEVASNPQEPWGLPQDNLDAFGGVNPQFFGAPGPGIFYQTTYNARDTVTKVVNSHSLRLGGDVYLEQDNDAQPWAARPQYSFRNLWDFANDAPYTESGNFDPRNGAPTSVTKYIRSNIYGFFVQDDWKARPNLTLNLGLRWEYFSPLHEKYGNISNPIPGGFPNPLLGTRIRTGGDLYNSSKNNWGPEIGFAYSPHNSQTLVLRGGAGIGYNRMQEAITLNGRSNPPFVANFNLFDQNVIYQVPGNVHQFYGWPSNPNAVLAFDANNIPTSGAPVSLTAIQNNLPTPVTYRYSLEVQNDFGHGWVTTLGYQGSQTRHYTVQNNLNWLFTPRNPRIQNLNYYYNGANASFNALLVELNHRFSRSFQIDGQYRWSKAIDEGSNDYFINDYPFDLRFARGPADYDVRHNFKLWGSWMPSIGSETGWVNKVFGGWNISGILNYHTGYPWTPVYSNTGCNVLYPNSGYCVLRPAAYFGGAGTDYSNDNLRKPSANFPNGALAYFAVPTVPTNGLPSPPGVGRNSFRGPNFFNVNMTLGKAFGLPRIPGLGEGAKLNLRADFYNIFNKLNLLPFVPYNNRDNPSTIISYDGVTSNPQFGQAQGAYSGRVVEVQARFSF